MHHFITVPIIEGDHLTIIESRCVHQIGRVLRMQQGDKIVIQHIIEEVSYRYTVELLNITKTQVESKILECKDNVKNMLNSMYVAMPNKASKAELIVQKLSELGIGKIVFRRAERSQLKEFNQKKMERMELIALEAVEQSHGRWLPEISVMDGKPSGELLVFEKADETGVLGLEQLSGGVVGPEGGFSPEELADFKAEGAKFVGLGNTVLRMETAAIVGGWLLTQSLEAPSFGA